MRCQVHRAVAVSVVALATACFDPSSGEPQDDDTTGGETTGGSQPTSASMTSTTASTTDPSDPSTTTPSTNPSTTMAPTSTETDPTDPTTTGPTDGTSSTGAGGGIPVTIYEIQQGEVPVDTVVEVSDAICTGVADNGFFVQDPLGGEWSGIWVFTGMGGLLPQLGDELTITGTYEEFFELSEINVSAGDVTVTASPGEGNVPAPETIALGDVGEPWESVFVRVEGNSLRVTEMHPMPAIHEFRVTDGIASVWVDDLMYDATTGDFPGLGPAASFLAIQGPLNFAFDEFRIAPRAMADLSGYAPP